MGSRYNTINIIAERATAANDAPMIRPHTPGYNLSADLGGGGGAMRVARTAASHGNGEVSNEIFDIYE